MPHTWKIYDPVSRHFNNPDDSAFGIDENMILYHTAQIPNQSHEQKQVSSN